MTRWWHSRGIHRAARNADPPTVPMLLLQSQTAGAAWPPGVRTWPPNVPTPPPAAPAPRCPCCGRPTVGAGWCCWVCRAAADGGWQLRPWRAGLHWTVTHTWACEQRRLAYAAIAWAVIR